MLALYRLIYKASGEPRRWWRRILFKKNGTPRAFYLRVMYNYSGQLRTFCEDWPVKTGFISRRERELYHDAAASLLSTLSKYDPALKPLESRVREFSVVTGVRFDRAASAWPVLYASLDRPYDRIVFVPWLLRGGADLVAIHAIRAIIERHGADSLLLVVTDSDRIEAYDWLPPALHVRVLSQFCSDLSLRDRVKIVSWLIRSVRPKSILNINSRVCWELIKSHGAILKEFVDIYAMLFCRDFDENGNSIGYADIYFGETFHHIRKIYFDNRSFIDELCEAFPIPQGDQSRLAVAYQPSPTLTGTGFARAVSGQRFPIMWAGRLCRQKNVELLIALAQTDPQISFNVFGSGEREYCRLISKAAKYNSNIALHGAYSHFVQLPTSSFGAFLYTTLWDGLPNVLLAAAAVGLPIVAPAVGGIREIINENTGWMVNDFNDASAFLKALHDIREHPDEALRRTNNMLAHLSEFHSWDSYMSSISTPPSFLD